MDGSSDEDGEDTEDDEDESRAEQDEGSEPEKADKYAAESKTVNGEGVAAKPAQESAAAAAAVETIMSLSDQTSRQRVESESSLVGTELAALDSTSSNKNDRPSVIQAKGHCSPNSPGWSTEAEREDSLDGARTGQISFVSYHSLPYES